MIHFTDAPSNFKANHEYDKIVLNEPLGDQQLDFKYDDKNYFSMVLSIFTVGVSLIPLSKRVQTNLPFINKKRRYMIPTFYQSNFIIPFLEF